MQIELQEGLLNTVVAPPGAHARTDVKGAHARTDVKGIVDRATRHPENVRIYVRQCSEAFATEAECEYNQPIRGMGQCAFEASVNMREVPVGDGGRN